MQKHIVKFLVKSEVKGDSCFSFGSTSVHDFRAEDGTLIHYSGEEVKKEENVNFQELYERNASEFVNENPYMFTYVQVLTSSIVRKRFAVTGKDLRDISQKNTENDAIEDVIGDTYVKIRLEYNRIVGTTKIDWNEFHLMAYRLTGQLYDAYSYKVGREMRNPSIENVFNAEGEIVNSYESILKQSSMYRENFLKDVSSVSDVLQENLSEVKEVSEIYGVNADLFQILAENLSEKELQFVVRIVNNVKMGYEVSNDEKKVFMSICKSFRKDVRISVRENQLAERERKYNERIMKQKARELKRLETKRIASEKKAERLQRLAEEKAEIERFKAEKAERARLAKEIREKAEKEIPTKESGKAKKSKVVKNSTKEVKTDNLPTPERLAELKAERERLEAEEREMILKLDAIRKAKKAVYGD